MPAYANGEGLWNVATMPLVNSGGFNYRIKNQADGLIYTVRWGNQEVTTNGGYYISIGLPPSLGGNQAAGNYSLYIGSGNAAVQYYSATGNVPPIDVHTYRPGSLYSGQDPELILPSIVTLQTSTSGLQTSVAALQTLAGAPKPTVGQSYTKGATAAVSGYGSHAIVAGKCGLYLHLGTIPSYYAITGTTPPRSDFGWVAFGTPDGYLNPERIVFADQIWLPLPPGVTRVAYNLVAGVSGTIQDLTWV